MVFLKTVLEICCAHTNTAVVLAARYWIKYRVKYRTNGTKYNVLLNTFIRHEARSNTMKKTETW